MLLHKEFEKLTRKKKSRTQKRFELFARSTYKLLSTPWAILYLAYSNRIDPAYKMNYWKRLLMGWRFYRNSRKVTSGTSWRAHLVMAICLLEMPPRKKGIVVECGCWKGSSTINLSIACRLAGRELHIFDSFEGMPPPEDGDPVAERTFKHGYIPGILSGSLQEVTDNVRRLGDIDSCTFHPGWFKDTLPGFQGEIVMMYLDVDFHASLHDCVLNLWPALVNGGIAFIDEYVNLPYCALFFFEKYWRKYFSCNPPGLIGSGTGVQVGMHYVDPKLRFDQRSNIQGPPESVAYCIKGEQAIWKFYPDE